MNTCSSTLSLPAGNHLVKEAGTLQLIAAKLKLCQRAVLPNGQGCIQDVLANQALERCPQAEGLAHLLYTESHRRSEM